MHLAHQVLQDRIKNCLAVVKRKDFKDVPRDKVLLITHTVVALQEQLDDLMRKGK